MNIRTPILTGIAVLTTIGSVCAKSTQPNVVVILADDIGWGDVGFNGAKLIKTPHLDAVAAKGVVCTNGYAPASTSTPTRYTMLTGEYAFRKKLNILAGDAPMSVGKPNIATFLKENGYKTAVIGKWHLGLGDGTLDWNRKVVPSPNDIGFDFSFIIPATGDRVPCVFMQNGVVVGHDVESGDAPIYVDYSKKIGNDPTATENPEQQKLKSIKDNHTMTIVNGIARMGWMTGGYRARWVDEQTPDILAVQAVKFIENNKNEPFFLFLPTHDAHEPRVANARFRGSSGCGIYGDVIQQFDHYIGEVVSSLKRAGVYENTILIISSDNGPMVKEAYDDGATENMNGHDPHAAMRGEKYTVYEGGLRVPYLVSWPSKIKKGRIEQRPVCLSNLLPTVASLVEITLDKSKWIDAQDDSSIYMNKKGATENPVYLQRGDGNALAVVYKGWKYVKYKAGREELYNLAVDNSENENLVKAGNQELIQLRDMLNNFIGIGA